MELNFDSGVLHQRLAALKGVYGHETQQRKQAEQSTEPANEILIYGEERNKTPRILTDALFCLSEEEESIIQSYPGNLHHLLKALVKTSKMTPSTSSYDQQDLDTFRHNMKHLFVSVKGYIEGWHPADLRTLWADGWREQDIIRFMMSRRVKYILCHNTKLISCLNFNGTTVDYFEK
jgi:hypothetical protein